MTAWPATLPPPALSSLNETPPDNLIRSTVDRGPAIVRRRTTANIRPLSFQLNLTKAQVQILDDFFVTTTFCGADEFTFTHPRTGVNHNARFVEAPSYSEREGVIYEASVSLELLP